MPRKPARANYIILFLLGALWGSSFGAIKSRTLWCKSSHGYECQGYVGWSSIIGFDTDTGTPLRVVLRTGIKFFGWHFWSLDAFFPGAVGPTEN